MVEKDGQVKFFALQHFQAGLGFLLRPFHAVGVAVPIRAHLDACFFGSSIVLFKIVVLLAQFPAVSSPDDRKLHPILGHLRPVNVSLMLGHIDSL